MSSPVSRRQIIKTGFLAAMGTTVFSGATAGNNESYLEDINAEDDPWMGFKTGIASYTFRKLSVDDTIKAMKRLNLHYISIKDFHLPLTSSTAERKAIIQKFKDAGITPMSCGNITMQNDE